MGTDQGNQIMVGGDDYGIGNLIWVIVVLAFVIMLILYLIRFLSRRNQSWFSSRSVRILGGVGLAPNKSLQLIEVGSSIYLIGVGEEIRLVDKVSDPEEVERIVAAFEQETSLHSGPLAPLIAKLTEKLRKRNTIESQELEDDASFHEMFESKLRQRPDRKGKLEKLRDEDNTTDRSGER